MVVEVMEVMEVEILWSDKVRLMVSFFGLA